MSGFPQIQGVVHKKVALDGVDIHVAEAGDPSGQAVILCHGFPELWYSWRHQLLALAAAGYHAVALDQRGYGGSTRPTEVTDYDIFGLTGDLVRLLDDMGQERAVFVGHDWGAIVVWAMAQMHPERVAAVVGMSVPFSPRGDLSTIRLLEAVMGDNFFYILHFQEPGRADAELASDPAEALRRFLGGGSASETGGAFSFGKPLPAATTTVWDWLPPVHELPPWLSQEELDVFAATFERTGFTGGINWYRNMHRNWELTEHLSKVKIEMPALFVAGDRDPVLTMVDPSAMDGWVTDLRGKVLVPDAGHWVQQEAPEQVNRALLDFLSTLT